jgi:hypothetical protein
MKERPAAQLHYFLQQLCHILTLTDIKPEHKGESVIMLSNTATVFMKRILKHAIAKPNTIADKAVNYYKCNDYLTNKLIFINSQQID